MQAKQSLRGALKMNKPYLLIAGEWYYPLCGTGDWIDTYISYEDAEKQIIYDISNRHLTNHTYLINNKGYDWYKIVNLETWNNTNYKESIDISSMPE